MHAPDILFSRKTWFTLRTKLESNQIGNKSVPVVKTVVGFSFFSAILPLFFEIDSLGMRLKVSDTRV